MIPKLKLLNRLVENGIVAVIRKVQNDKVEQVAESLIRGGVNTLEVTVDDPNGFDIIKRLSAKFESHALIGAGTVLDSQSTKLAIDSGAKFIVSPILNEEVIRLTLRYGIISIPGAITPTEAITAIEYGADIVKVFPASSVGPGFIKQLRGPLPHIPIIPTGGINLDNIAEFVRAGAVAIGTGSNLVDNKRIKANQFDEIEKMARQYVNEVKKVRG